MDAPAALRWRNALDPMTASLIVESFDVLSRYREGNAVEAAGRGHHHRAVALSTFSKRKALVCDRKLSNEELRIIAALGGTDLECDGRHLLSPSNCRCPNAHGLAAAAGERGQRKWEMVFLRVVMQRLWQISMRIASSAKTRSSRLS